jgi:hypothetical protein
MAGVADTFETAVPTPGASVMPAKRGVRRRDTIRIPPLD